MCNHSTALGVRKLADVKHLVVSLHDISKFRIRTVKNSALLGAPLIFTLLTTSPMIGEASCK
jgi:hypothetical protein